MWLCGVALLVERSGPRHPLGPTNQAGAFQRGFYERVWLTIRARGAHGQESIQNIQQAVQCGHWPF